MRRRFVLILFLLLLSSDSVMACGVPKLGSNTQIPTTFVFEKGWEIPRLAGASIVIQKRDESGGEVIEYKPQQNVSVALQGFELSSDSKRLLFVPGYWQWVERISEYRVNGRAYAYTVQTVSTGKTDPPMWRYIKTSIAKKKGTVKKGTVAGVLGCGWTMLRYFDADGDGSFESLEYVGFGGPFTNSTRCPTVPEWALKLLPNRDAAERCSKSPAQEKEYIQKGMLELPAELEQLFRQQPVLPVLASEGKKSLAKQ